MRKNDNNLKKYVKIALVTLIVYLAMKYALPVVIPFVFGAGLAVILNPLVEKIMKKTRAKRGVISTAVVVVMLAVVGAACYFAGRSVCMQLTALAKNADTIESSIRSFVCDCCEMAEQNLGVNFGQADLLFVKMQNKVKAGFTNTALPYLLKNSVGYAKVVFSIISIVLISIISGLLILTDYPKIRTAVHRSEIGAAALQVYRHAKSAGGTYLKAQFFILLIISLICVAGLLLTGNPYAILAGMGIGLCDALPFIGTGTVFVPWMLIDILNGNYILAAVYGILYVICSFVRQMLEPRLIGERLGCPPIVVLMSIYIGIHVYGTAGVLLGPISVFLIYEIVTWQADFSKPDSDV